MAKVDTGVAVEEGGIGVEDTTGAGVGVTSGEGEVVVGEVC